MLIVLDWAAAGTVENNELIGDSVVCNGEGKMGSSMVVESSTVDSRQ